MILQLENMELLCQCQNIQVGSQFVYIKIATFHLQPILWPVSPGNYDSYVWLSRFILLGVFKRPKIFNRAVI